MTLAEARCLASASGPYLFPVGLAGLGEQDQVRRVGGLEAEGEVEQVERGEVEVDDLAADLVPETTSCTHFHTHGRRRQVGTGRHGGSPMDRF